MRSGIAALALLSAVFSVNTQAQAQNFPAKPIHIVVPASPGGVTDILGRALGQRFSETWGQPGIIENKAGANNIIAAEYVAKAAPDGYTLFLAPEVTFTVNPAIQSKLPYELSSFVPVTALVRLYHALIVRNNLPVNNMKELIDLAKSKPGQLSYGSFGMGSTGHVNMELLQGMAGVKFNHVAYKGATPALVDVAAGHLDFMFISSGTAIQQWKTGKVKWLGIGSPKRMGMVPEIPTVAEAAGLPGYEAVSWFGLFAPAGTPRDVVQKINSHVQGILHEPAFRDKYLTPQLFEPIPGTPEQFTEYIHAEAQKFSKVLRDAKVKAE
jgi:tripartite-type tricarboxylate transporter receptor subunit TctC